MQLSKVLSSDADKAVQPYLPRSASSIPPADTIAKHHQACERLSNYRQPIGIGVLRFTDDSGRISGSNMSYKMEADYNTVEMGVTFFCQRVILSDQQIGQVSTCYRPCSYSSIYRFIHSSILSSIHLSYHPSIYSSIYPSIHIFIYLIIYLIIYPSIYSSLHLTDLCR